MPYLGRRGALAPLTSADIPAGIVEGTDVAFLENSSGQTLAGTYSTERMYLSGRTGSAPNDYNYKLEGNVTVTGHLALGTIADADGELGSVVTQATGYTLGSGVTFPAGHVIQVVTGVHSTETFTQSTGFVPTGIRINITPKSASSKFFITCNTSGYSHDGNVQVSYFTIYRDSTNLGASSNGYADIYQGSGSGHDIGTNICISELDSPNTTSGITYEMYVRSNNASYKTSWSMNGSKSTIIVMEIAG